MCVSWKSNRKIKYAKNSVIVFHFNELFVKTFTLSLGTNNYFKKSLLQKLCMPGWLCFLGSQEKKQTL